jgi:hypothetical protein
MVRDYAFIGALVLVAGCASPAATPTTGIATPSATASVAPSEVASPLVGEWSRTQDCEGMLAAFVEAGIAHSHAEWIVGNWVGDPADVEADPHDLCANARPAEVHSHFFTADGGFGSRDASGEQVDDGDYEIVDSDTVSFASHSAEFGYSGDILVDYAVSGDTATFEVQLPTDCTDACLEAHAWALSAFFGPDPWTRE